MSDRELIRVCVKHRFSASPERVFDAWLDPEKAAKFFFATATGQIVRAEIDARVGGGFRIVDRRKGEEVAHIGTYRELERPRRIVFSFRVGDDAAEESLVTIEIAPLAAGCEMTIEHVLDPKYAEYVPRTRQGWAKMLELAAQVAVEEPATCGAGLARSATFPAKVAQVFGALADMLERHRATLVPSDPQARGEDDAYRELAASYRELAQQVARVAARMAACRDLPLAAHDESAFGPQRQAFEVLVQTQADLLATLRLELESNQQMLEEES